MSNEEMTFTEACDELVKLIEGGYFAYTQEAGLAVAEFCNANQDDETPRMCLSIAKNVRREND